MLALKKNRLRYQQNSSYSHLLKDGLLGIFIWISDIWIDNHRSRFASRESVRLGQA